MVVWVVVPKPFIICSDPYRPVGVFTKRIDDFPRGTCFARCIAERIEPIGTRRKIIDTSGVRSHPDTTFPVFQNRIDNPVT